MVSRSCAPWEISCSTSSCASTALNLGADATARARTGAGGQAANVAAWVTELGGQGRLVAKRANDAAGSARRAGLVDHGVGVFGPQVEGHNGVVVSIVAPTGERTMASDRGVAPQLRADELEMRWFGGCAWLHVTGYSLFRSPIDEAAAKAAGAVRGQGGRISVDLSSWSMIRDFGSDRLRRRLELLAPDVVFGNAEELGDRRLLPGGGVGAEARGGRSRARRRPTVARARCRSRRHHRCRRCARRGLPAGRARAGARRLRRAASRSSGRCRGDDHDCVCDA